MSAASTGLANAELARQFIEATRRAQSHLAQVGVTTPLVPGVRSGNDGDGFSWQVRVSAPVVHAGSAPSQSAELGLYTVEVAVGWRSRASVRSVALRSLRTQ